MLVDMLTMWVVEVDVVQIVDMIIVNDGGMSTVLVVNMGVAFVF
jgi:hypothetical protein